MLPIIPTFAPLKKLIAKRIIKATAANSAARERKLVPLKAGTRIGFVFEADDESQRKLMYQVKERFQNLGADCTFLGFINEKEFPAGLTFKPGFDYFLRKDLQWHKLPNREKLNQFTEIPMDYLVYASIEENRTLLQFAAKSKAFRIGPHFKDYTDCFDFMVDLGKAEDLKKYLDICEHYIKQFKS